MNYVDKADQNGYTQTVMLLKQIFLQVWFSFLAGLSCVKAWPTGKKQSGRAGQNGYGTPHPCRFF